MSRLTELIWACVRSHACETRELVSLEAFEQAYVEAVLESLGGNKTRAARILGIDRRSLYRRLASYQAAREKAQRNSDPIGLHSMVEGNRE